DHDRHGARRALPVPPLPGDGPGDDRKRDQRLDRQGTGWGDLSVPAAPQPAPRVVLGATSASGELAVGIEGNRWSSDAGGPGPFEVGEHGEASGLVPGVADDLQTER